MSPLQWPRRGVFLATLLAEMGRPYRWGGKGEFASDGGRMFDCSGLVTWALYSSGGPDWRQTHGADGLFRELAEPLAAPPFGVAVVPDPRPGDLCFYGTPEKATHVMVWLGGAVVGASGGDSTTTTLEKARAQRACVKPKPTHLYRLGRDGKPDFLGFRRLPLTDGPATTPQQ